MIFIFTAKFVWEVFDKLNGVSVLFAGTRTFGGNQSSVKISHARRRNSISGKAPGAAPNLPRQTKIKASGGFVSETVARVMHGGAKKR